MKNLKKGLLLLGIGLMATACAGNGDPSGYYSFKMGKASSSSFGATLQLTNEDYIFEPGAKNPAPADKQVKQFTFTLDITTPTNAGDIITKAASKLSGGVNGYFYIGDEKVNKDGAKELFLGFNLIQILDALDIKTEELPQVIRNWFEVNPDALSKICYSTILGKNVDLTIPVSLNDLTMNFAWYGIYLPFDHLGQSKIISDEFAGDGYKHLPGEKITEKETKYMNDKFASTFGNTLVYRNSDLVGYLYTKENPDNPLIKDGYIQYVNGASTVGPSDDLTVKFAAYTGSIKDIKTYDDVECNLTIENGTNKITAIKSKTLVDNFLPIFVEQIQEPFEFRAAHQVDITLKKEDR